MKKSLFALCLLAVFGLSACSSVPMGQEGNPYVAHFAFDKASVCPKEAKTVASFAKAVKAEKPSKVIVTGHTDSVGSDAYNMNLGQRRAQTIKKILVKNGVCSKKIVVKSAGESKPVACNKSAKGRAENRRAEVIYVK